MGFGRGGDAFRRGGQGQATQNERDMNCGDNNPNLRKGVAMGSKNYPCRNFQKKGTCRFGNDCKFSHVLEENIGFGPPESSGGFGRSSPPVTGGFDNRSSGFGGGGGQYQHGQQQSTFDSYQSSSSRFRSFQSLQNFHQGNGGGGFGFGSDQQRPSPTFINQTGFGSSQRTQLNTTPSSHGDGGGGGLPFGGGGSRNGRLNLDFSSAGESGSPSRQKPCRYWDKEGKSCYFGNNCKFSHAIGGNDSERRNAYGGGGEGGDRNASMRDNKMCNNWLRDGTCRFGDKCRFSHPPSASMDIINSLRSENEGLHNGGGFGGGSTFGSRGGGGFGKLSLAGVPNGGGPQHISQALGSGGGGAAGFGGQAHFGNNVFGNDHMDAGMDMAGIQQSSMATDFGGVFAKHPHTVATGLGRTTDTDMQPVDAAISAENSSFTSLNHLVYSSGRTESSTTACSNTLIASLDRAEEVKVDRFDLTEDEKEAFLSDVFTFGMIPEVPPPLQFCRT
eukprot:472316_1